MAHNEENIEDELQQNDRSEKESSYNSLDDEVIDDNLLANIDSSDGCKHYKRKCAFVAPCCGKQYTCRVCHDDEENHEIDRYKVTHIVCLKCNKNQLVCDTCTECGVKFADYFCSVCHLYDKDKGQFHCVPCGLCRVGGQENYFHCSVCDLCLALSIKESHKCIEKVSRSNCPVCMEDLHTSRQANVVLPCSHIMHSLCYTDMMKTGNYACPLCAKSMVSMKEVWELLDREVSNTDMPEEYRETYVFILCRDCNKESRVKFHVVGLKCAECGSYNTCRTADRDESLEGASNTTPASGPDNNDASAGPSDSAQGTQ